MADPYKYFRIEARELLEQLGQGTLDLEKDVPSRDVIARLLRLAHTLKGAARVVKQPEIAEDAHALEDLFTTLRGTSVPPPREQIDRVLSLLDRITVYLTALAPNREPERERPSGLPQEESFHGFRPDPQDVQELIDGVGEAHSQLGALRPSFDQTDGIRHLIELIDDQVSRLRALDREAGGTFSGIERVGSMIEELRARFGSLEREVSYGIDRIDRELRQVGEAAARLRLVPASAVFQFLERAARDAARALGKRVTFAGRGGDLRVDSGMLAIAQGALLQVVRNAVAHGIESNEAERVARGKPPDGRVTVVVSRRGTSISFVCSDDGRGIDVDAVRRMLQRKGLSAGEREPLDVDEVLALLLKSGVSTSDTVTDVAGRGIGLDVVREAAERLSGSVAIHTAPHMGTSVELLVPFSSTSFEALLVEVDGAGAVIPQDAIQRTLRVAPGDITETASGDVLLHEGRGIPFVPLRRVIRPTESQARSTVPCSAFVIAAGGSEAAFSVDRIVGTATAVTRPLPMLAPTVSVVVGASLDTRGHPRLVLDPVSLVAEAQRPTPPQSEILRQRTSILVVDDSLTTRMLEQSILESAGYDVSLASSGEEGLEKARRGQFALFLVDVEMPGMDGFTFIEQIQSDPALRGVPSILVTSRGSAGDRRRGRDVGARGYIVKDEFDQRVLLDRIRSLVG